MVTNNEQGLKLYETYVLFSKKNIKKSMRSNEESIIKNLLDENCHVNTSVPYFISFNQIEFVYIILFYNCTSVYILNTLVYII
jgi:hypothetical protein